MTTPKAALIKIQIPIKIQIAGRRINFATCAEKLAPTLLDSSLAAGQLHVNLFERPFRGPKLADHDPGGDELTVDLAGLSGWNHQFQQAISAGDLGRADH